MSLMGMDCIGSIISMLCFHSEFNVAEDGVLVELIMMMLMMMMMMMGIMDENNSEGRWAR